VALPDINTWLAELSGSDEVAAEAAALALAKAGAVALPGLAHLLDSPEADDRWWAVRTLAAMSEPKLEWLQKALRDPNPEVRAAAALAFVAHPDPAASDGLIAILGDEDSVVGAAAVSALVAIGSKVVPKLLEAYDGSSPRGRTQIMRALCELRDHRSISLMLKASEKGSAATQYWARQGLEALGLDMVYMKPE
jgi:HEAT repeat protein